MYRISMMTVLVILIGAVSCNQWCGNFKSNLKKLDDDTKLSSAMKTVIDFLLAVGRREKAWLNQDNLDGFKSKSITFVKAKDFVQFQMENCDSLCAQWEQKVEEKILAANDTTQMLDIMEVIARFFTITEAPGSASMIREIMKRMDSLPLAAVKEKIRSDFRKLY